MTRKQAVKILMLSPVYYKLGIHDRLQLIKDYCKQFSELQQVKSRNLVR